jgi:predicted transcriptional regulator
MDTATVSEIKDLYSTNEHSYEDIGKKFNISKSTAWRTVQGPDCKNREPKNKVDWEELLEACNNIKKTNFKTVREMLTVLYAQERSAERIGDKLGVCHTTVYAQFRKQNIKSKPKGGFRYSECLRRIIEIPLKELEHMTSREIAKIVGFGQERVLYLLNEYGIKYNKKTRARPKTAVEEILAIPGEERRSMTAQEVADRVRCSLEHAQRTLNANKLVYRRFNNRTKKHDKIS